MAVELKVSFAANRELRVSVGQYARRGNRSKDSGEEKLSSPDVCPPSPLDIGSEFQREDEPVGKDDPAIPKPGWGTLPRARRFGAAQKRAMLQAGAIVDMYAPGRQLILTGTLPGSFDECNRTLAAYSGYAMNRVMQWVRRITKSHLHFGVWEYQKRGALHFHLAISYENEAEKSKLMDGFHAQWVKILKDISEQSGVDLFAKDEWYSHQKDTSKVQADAQEIKKSVAAYFAKYATKGYENDVKKRMFRRKMNRYSPSRWIVLSRRVSQLCEQERVSASVVAGRGEVEAKLEDVMHVVEQSHIRRYEYNWKVLHGKTMVFYFETEDFEDIKREVLKVMRPYEMAKAEKKTTQWMLKNDAFCKAWTRRYGSERTSWRASLLVNWLEGTLTNRGFEEFNRLAEEVRIPGQ